MSDSPSAVEILVDHATKGCVQDPVSYAAHLATHLMAPPTSIKNYRNITAVRQSAAAEAKLCGEFGRSLAPVARAPTSVKNALAATVVSTAIGNTTVKPPTHGQLIIFVASTFEFMSELVNEQVNSKKVVTQIQQAKYTINMSMTILKEEVGLFGDAKQLEDATAAVREALCYPEFAGRLLSLELPYTEKAKYEYTDVDFGLDFSPSIRQIHRLVQLEYLQAASTILLALSNKVGSGVARMLAGAPISAINTHGTPICTVIEQKA